MVNGYASHRGAPEGYSTFKHLFFGLEQKNGLLLLCRTPPVYLDQLLLVGSVWSGLDPKRPTKGSFWCEHTFIDWTVIFEKEEATASPASSVTFDLCCQDQQIIDGVSWPSHPASLSNCDQSATTLGFNLLTICCEAADCSSTSTNITKHEVDWSEVNL